MTAAATEARTAKAASRRWRRGGSAYLYLVPALLVMGVITLYPLLYQVWMSFTDYGIQNLRFDSPPANFVGIDNYVNVLTSQLEIPNYYFVRLILYNMFWAFSNVAIHVVLGVSIALLMHTKGLWFKRLYRSLFILPVVIPPLIVATVWKNMYDANYGAINQLPMLPYAIYGFVITCNLFHLAYFMSAGGPFGRTELLVTQAYRLVNDQQLYGVAASFAVVMFFILLTITLITNRMARATKSYADL
jgi:ABC-type sugar transport system permease subunit